MVSFRPLSVGLWDPFQMAFFMAYKWWLLTTCYLSNEKPWLLTVFFGDDTTQVYRDYFMFPMKYLNPVGLNNHEKPIGSM